MSVPLDRLYNFLHDVCNHHDLVIYRFFPHGSRKIDDLTVLQSFGHDYTTMLVGEQKSVIFHDQEPLNFDLYQSIKFEQVKQFPEFDDDLLESYKEVVARLTPEMNLKWAIGLGAWRVPVVLVHSEKRSAELDKYKNLNFIPVYWWSHALISRDWFRYAKYDRLLDKKSTNPRDFLIYNRAWTGTREYRIKLAELLIKHDLTKNCMTWFSPVDDGQLYSEHIFKNNDFKINNYNLEQHYTCSTVDSNASADYSAADYQQTRIELVLETLFDDSRLHLTEKILRPIACGQPFMLAATYGSLEYLRSYGFKTFEPWINESYDTIKNPAQRLEAIVQEMRRIASLSSEDKIYLSSKLASVASYNKELFFSAVWQQTIVNEYLTNFTQGMREFNQS